MITHHRRNRYRIKSRICYQESSVIEGQEFSDSEGDLWTKNKTAISARSTSITTQGTVYITLFDEATSTSYNRVYSTNFSTQLSRTIESARNDFN